MAGYILRRVLGLILVLLFVSFVTFILVRLAPGLIVLGGRRVDPATVDALRVARLSEIPSASTWRGSARHR